MRLVIILLKIILLKDEESARDDHFLACNFAKYSPVLIFFACFLALIFHQVMWQHMQGVVGVLVTALLEIYRGNFQ